MILVGQTDIPVGLAGKNACPTHLAQRGSAKAE